jgi:hypothetical protein
MQPTMLRQCSRTFLTQTVLFHVYEKDHEGELGETQLGLLKDSWQRIARYQ